MIPPRALWRPLIALLLVLAFLPATSAAAATTVGPKPYYLALGDSLAWGYQPDGQFFRGYDVDLYAQLLGRGARVEANLGCPGETSGSFLAGGCPYAALHKYPYRGPQLRAALDFLAQHRGRVGPVTIDLGGNDFLPLIDPSTFAPPPAAAFAQALAAFDANFSGILAQLRAAMGGTGDLATMTYYFPYQNRCPNLLPLVEAFNQHLAADAQRNGALVADVFGAFGGAATPNPNLCTDTWICSGYRDVHATSLGYAVIARAFEGALVSMAM